MHLFKLFYFFHILFWCNSRIINVKSADEFYSLMNVFTREIMEFGLLDANQFVKVIQKNLSFRLWYFNCNILINKHFSR